MPQHLTGVKDWQDKPSTATPITAAELERIEGLALEGVRVPVTVLNGGFTLGSSNENEMVLISVSGSVNVTIPTDANSPTQIGYVVQLVQMGAGLVVPVAQAGVTLNRIGGQDLNTMSQYGVVTLIKTGANTWLGVPPPRPSVVTTEAAYQALATKNSQTIYFRTA